jgi:hypothetical protein
VTRWAILAPAALLFALLATANSAGYRYGVSDQAFYATAVVKDLHPSWYPRDTPLLEVEAHLMWSDEILAGLARMTGVDLPPLFLAIYLVTLVTLFASGVAFARSLGCSWWAVAAFLVLLTLRHRISKTAANSLEAYMHPRTLSFALGVAALTAWLRGRTGAGVLWLLASAAWHPTTAFWFGLASAPMALAGRPRAWRWLALLAIPAVVLGVWALWHGPLAGRVVTMDAAWLRVLADKDYLFPHEWPLYAWMANLAYPLVIVICYRMRKTRGLLVPREPALVASMFVLFGLFLISVPLSAARLALVVQMQVPRVFWLLDFVAAAYVAWWLADAVGPRLHVRAALIALLTAVSLGRGIFLLSGDRRLFAMSLPDTPWIDAMTWLERQPAGWYVLADPGHAWKYGVSVRLAAGKDTLVEAGKDTALAMYDRPIAMAVSDRLGALSNFETLSTDEARRLATRYGLDVAVLERSQHLDLPELYHNARFVVYQLR